MPLVLLGMMATQFLKSLYLLMPPLGIMKNQCQFLYYLLIQTQYTCATDFLTMALLWYGFHDAIRMGDGNRIFTN